MPATALNKNLTAVEETLYQTKNQSNQDPLNYPIRLNNKLAALGGVVGSAEAAPTAQSYAVYDELVTQIDAELQKLAQIMRTEVPAFNQLVRDQNIPAVVVKPPSTNSDRRRPSVAAHRYEHFRRGAATEGRPYNKFLNV